MTNKELIKLLRKLPPNFQVIIPGSGCTLDRVEKDNRLEEIYLQPLTFKLIKVEA